MKRTTSELPTINPNELPYLPVYRRSLGRIGWVSISMVGAALLAVVVFTKPHMDTNAANTLTLAVFALSVLVILWAVISVVMKRAETANFLNAQSDDFIEAVQTRYGVTLSTDVLYSLAQGGTTQLPDNSGEVKEITLASGPDIKSTKLVAFQ